MEESQRTVCVVEPTRAGEPGAAGHPRGIDGVARARNRQKSSSSCQLHSHGFAQECATGPVGDLEALVRNSRRGHKERAGGECTGGGPRLAQQTAGAAAAAAGRLQDLLGTLGNISGGERGAREDHAAVRVQPAGRPCHQRSQLNAGWPFF